MTPQQIATHILSQDAYGKWLGLELLEVDSGYCKLAMKTRADMCNGIGILHGGVIFSLADAAMAVAANSHGRVCVALEVSITFTLSIQKGDILTATAREKHLGNRTAAYSIDVFNQNDFRVALAKGTAYRTPHIVGEAS